MGPLAVGAPTRGTDAASVVPDQVAGRIAGHRSMLTLAVEAWLAHLRARNRKPRTIACFRQTVERAALDLGWQAESDLTFESVVGYLDRRRGGWKGTTYNRNLCVFRSLTRFLAASGRMPADPLALAGGAIDDASEGSRAATTEEARRLVLHAWVRDQADRRSRSMRSVYWLCLFAHGCRFGEPAQWRWRNVALTHAVPHIVWTPEISKNHQRRFVALAPELAAALRTLAARGAAPDGPVFGRLPNRPTFRSDRDAAGIPAADYRGRNFSPHSARKWFSTAMTGVGVPEKMVDYLMRHAGRVEHRYYDPSLEEQAAALSKLPRLWPEQAASFAPPAPSSGEGSNGRIVDNLGAHGVDLTSGGRLSDDDPGAPTTVPHARSCDPPSPSPRSATSNLAGTGHTVEHARGSGADGLGARRARSEPVLDQGMPIPGSIAGVDRTALAEFLESLAKLLRSGGGHAPDDNRRTAS